ncbi:hypothetical protein Nepgr_027432 [Nepenthes gracilis]|uniref:Uncharacterized protein n=1 Tax=Nepenthes gracilis TaxID=150966 RepID=A0AAD3Y337_NEPGR|nr:hypothetical protein Nepgr_027432 [Nepenthes gracilis]
MALFITSIEAKSAMDYSKKSLLLLLSLSIFIIFFFISVTAVRHSHVPPSGPSRGISGHAPPVPSTKETSAVKRLLSSPPNLEKPINQPHAFKAQ